MMASGGLIVSIESAKSTRLRHPRITASRLTTSGSERPVTVQDDPTVQGSTAAPTELVHRGRRETSTGSGATSMRPLSDPGTLGRLAPVAGVAISAVVLGLLPPTSSSNWPMLAASGVLTAILITVALRVPWVRLPACLLYTSDAADDLLCVDLGG